MKSFTNNLVLGIQPISHFVIRAEHVLWLYALSLGGLIWSIHLKRIHHPHCIQTLCIPRSLGHNTVPRQPAQGHLCHTCQHLIKSTQNAFAKLRSLWHSEVSLTF